MDIQYIPVSSDSDLSTIRSLLASENLPELDPGQCEAIIAAKNGNMIVGCAAIERHGDDGLLRSVAVHSAYRGHGLGRQLTRRMIIIAREQGYRQMYLLTTTADEYFGRFDFRPVSREEVAPEVRRSAEFTTSCPDSARVYRLNLSPDQKTPEQ
jgi:amino-acid N-acetyltransferase